MGLYENKNGVLSPIAGRGNIDGVYKAQGILGAKNILPYPYKDTTKTVAGMTYTDNGDGSVTANASTATTSTSSFIFKRFNEDILPKGKYIITDEGASITNTYLAINKVDSSGTYIADLLRLYPDKHKAEFTVDYNGYEQISVMIYTRANVTADNLIFKPMLRLASDTDDTYRQYAMTNKELTEVEEVPITWNFPEGVEADYNYSKCYRVGKLCNLIISMRIAIPEANKQITIGSIPTKYIKLLPASDHPTNYGGFTIMKRFTTNVGLIGTENYIIGVKSEDGTIYVVSDTVVTKANHFISGVFTFPTR